MKTPVAQRDSLLNCPLAAYPAPDTTGALLSLLGAPPEGVWLDLGCGESDTAAGLRALGCLAFGVDFAPNHSREANEAKTGIFVGANSNLPPGCTDDTPASIAEPPERKTTESPLCGDGSQDFSANPQECAVQTARGARLELSQPLLPGGANIIAADMRALPIASASIDGCAAECSLSVCGDAAAALAEAARVLKAGGALLISDVYFKSESSPSLSLGAPATAARWRELLEIAGFDIVSFSDASAAWKSYIARLIWDGAEPEELFGAGGSVKGAGYFLARAKKVK